MLSRCAGFHFPTRSKLVTIGLIDPKATDQKQQLRVRRDSDCTGLRRFEGVAEVVLLDGRLPQWSTINVTYKSNPQRYNGGYVTEDFFKIIGVSPIIGRDSLPRTTNRGAKGSSSFGNEIWKRDFNGDPDIVGQTVRVNSKPATIIGVMPPNFKFPNLEELWTPLYNQFPPIPRGQLVIAANNAAPSVMGRLKPGVTFDQANAEFINIAGQFGAGISKNEPKFYVNGGAPAREFAPRRAIPANGLGDVGRGNSRFTDRVP